MMSILSSRVGVSISENFREVFSRISTNNRLSVPIGWGDHQSSWENLNKSLADNNPEFGLISVWAILEKEMELKFSKKLRKIGQGKNASICDLASKELKYDNSSKSQLKSAMKKRNKVAHGSNVSVTWSDVNCVLKTAYQLFNRY